MKAVGDSSKSSSGRTACKIWSTLSVSRGAADQFPFESPSSMGGELTCRPEVIVELNLVLDDLSAAPVDQFDEFCRQRGCSRKRILRVRIPLRQVSFSGSEDIHLSPVRSKTLRCCSDGSGLTGPIPRNRRTKLCRVKGEPMSVCSPSSSFLSQAVGPSLTLWHPCA